MTIEELNRIKESAAKKIGVRYQKDGYKVTVGMGTCGIASGARPVLLAFVEQVANKNLLDVTVLQSGCMGDCDHEPVVVVQANDGTKTTYCNVKVDDVEKIVNEHLIGNKPVVQLLKKD